MIGLSSALLFWLLLVGEKGLLHVHDTSWLHSLFLSHCQIFPTKALNQVFAYTIVLLTSQVFVFLCQLLINQMSLKFIHKSFTALNQIVFGKSLLFSLFIGVIVTVIYSLRFMDVYLCVPIFVAYTFILVAYQSTHNQIALVISCYMINVLIVLTSIFSI